MTSNEFAAWRKRRGFSYSQTAIALGYTRSQLIQFEKGKARPGYACDAKIRLLEMAFWMLEHPEEYRTLHDLRAILEPDFKAIEAARNVRKSGRPKKISLPVINFGFAP